MKSHSPILGNVLPRIIFIKQLSELIGKTPTTIRTFATSSKYRHLIPPQRLQGDLRNECKKLDAQRMQIFVPTAVQVERPAGSSPSPIKRPRLR